MVKEGNPDLAYIQNQLAWENKEMEEKGICSKEQNLNVSDYKQPTNAIVNNYFNITINVSPDTAFERISVLVEKLTTIVDRIC